MISELHPGFKFHQYQLLDQIGAGGQGVVWSAEDSQRNDVVAIKFNEIGDSEQEQADDEIFERQLEKLLKVQHANVLPIYDSGLVNQVRYLVSPYIAGGSVFDRLRRGPLPMGDALRFSTEIASALDHLHSQGIIHRDIKSSNVLLSLRNRTYLADFGLARSVSATTQAMHTGRGTPPYAPPEQHKLLGISSKSDVYSFGILLFEIFTGQLPWGGENILGIKQLYSNSELPDPCELNGILPPLMKDVLRRITSADPSRRPSSVGEAMKMIYYIFNIRDSSFSGALPVDQSATRAHDADDLIDQNLADWVAGSSRGDLGLTKFALIHRDYKTQDKKKVQGEVGPFLLFHALKYGYKDDYWWSSITDSGVRLSVAYRLFAMQNEVVAVRVLDYLVRDQHLRLLPADQSVKVAALLLEMASKSKSRALSGRLFSGLRAITQSSSTWDGSKLNPELNNLLGELAVEDSDLGEQAAQVVGHLHSLPALNFILKKAPGNLLIPVLLEVQQSAGNLPFSVPRDIRIRVTLEWIAQRLVFQPARLFGAYMAILTGTTLGIGSQVYLTYRLPEFMDIARISSSLVQGLITGTIFSLGILLARVIVERFHGANTLLRIVLATLTGTVGMNIALFIFHVLFINTSPSGLLMSLGCALISFAYALGGVIRFRVARMFLSVGAILLAITGTWWVHVTMAASITELTPLFYYDFNWSASQIFFTSTVVALWIGVFGNLVRLGAEEIHY